MSEYSFRLSRLFNLPSIAALVTALVATPTFASTYSVAPNIAVGIVNALPNPAAAPPGANLQSCSLKQHPYPVVLVNGTFSVMEDDFGALAPDLANAGYCVYTFNYGGASPNSLIQATGSAISSASVLASYVQQVLSQTGATKVDLVGHSQGGMLAEYYAKVIGGAPYIHNLVGLSPTTHGTTLDGLTLLASVFPGANQLVGAACPACADQENGSAMIQQLDSGPIAQAGVGYTIIETKDEFVVTPVGSSFINEPGVTNEYVQSSCPLDAVDHADLSYDNVAIQLVKNALSPSTARAPNCAIAFPWPAQ
ncbi:MULTISPECIES: triacylglycerol lipase [Paraburkholderia]|uniref:esterase/lipase family protein n=1 Tax=Paraburkholderia TaxID=1822464 RepID=UPI002256A822|nr:MULTISPECIES: alpha/beta fold hydrolase [Paraburkholderia]MCX4164696.1 alpha/beta fold hydrolase [Paraburkholderia megapolitana]